jgi:hypothetical protein
VWDYQLVTNVFMGITGSSVAKEMGKGRKKGQILEEAI